MSTKSLKDTRNLVAKPLHGLQIRNVIATADLKQAVDASKFNNYSWGRFDVEFNYNGKVGYVKEPRMNGRVTVFFSGKMISTGAKDIPHSIWQLERTMTLLEKNGFVKRVELRPIIRNIVATFDMKRRLDLSKAAIRLAKSIYEPEQFPGLIHKTEGSSTCLIFASGKAISVGSRSEEELRQTVRDIANELDAFAIREVFK